MTRPRKFRRGERIATAEEAIRLILSGEWIYFSHKPTHPGWSGSWSVQSIKSWVGAGYLSRAVRNEEEIT